MKIFNRLKINKQVASQPSLLERKESYIYKDKYFEILVTINNSKYNIRFGNGGYRTEDSKIENALKKFFKKCSKEDDLLEDLLYGNGWVNNPYSKIAKKILENMVD